MNASTTLRSLYVHPMARFAAVGALSTVVDILILNLMARAGSPVWLAAGIGYACGWTNGFFLNSRYVFKTDRTVSRYLKFALVAIGGLILTELIIHALHVSSLHMGLLPAKLVAVGAVFFWNYGLSKLWAFS